MSTQDPYGRDEASAWPPSAYTSDQTQTHPYQRPEDPVYQQPQDPVGHESLRADPIPAGQPYRTEDTTRAESPYAAEARTEERFGGINWGAGFFGWLVAVAMAVLVTGLAGAALTATGSTAEVIPSELDGDSGAPGIVAAAVLVVVLVFAYYTGGYVAGRMSRFVGGRQGVGVWVTGLVSTGVTVGVGIVFGSQYDLLGKVNLATIPVPTEAVSVVGAATAGAAVFGTLFAAMLGGKVGCRYHRKVDAFRYDAP